MPQGAPATGDGALTSQRTTVVRNRGETGECRSFFACAGAEFGKCRDQRQTGYRSDPGHRTEDPRGIRETPVATQKL